MTAGYHWEEWNIGMIEQWVWAKSGPSFVEKLLLCF